MTIVLDASATLAVLFEEPGADVVLASSRGAIISAVNLDEVLHKCERRNIPAVDAEGILAKLLITVVPFDHVQARASARLHPDLHRRGISFADRACLALAEVAGGTILSADSDWTELDLPIDIRLIR